MHWGWLLTKGGLIRYLLKEPLSSGVLMLYLAVRLDSSNLCEVYVTSGKDETDSFMGEFPHPLSYWNSQSPGGRQISLHFSSGENSSGPWAILAWFCSYSFQSIHTCLCVTSLSLLDCNPTCWWCGSGGRNSRHCISWREPTGDNHQLWQAALTVLTQSNDLSFPSSSAIPPLEAGKLIFLLVLSAVPKCILCMKMWDRFLSSTYGQLSKTYSQRVLIVNKTIQRWLSFEGTASREQKHFGDAIPVQHI